MQRSWNHSLDAELVGERSQPAARGGQDDVADAPAGGARGRRRSRSRAAASANRLRRFDVRGVDADGHGRSRRR